MTSSRPRTCTTTRAAGQTATALTLAFIALPGRPAFTLPLLFLIQIVTALYDLGET